MKISRASGRKVLLESKNRDWIRVGIKLFNFVLIVLIDIYFKVFNK